MKTFSQFIIAYFISITVYAADNSGTLKILGLSEILNGYFTSPMLKVSKTRMETNFNRLKQAQADDDWELFGTVGLSQNSEVATANDDREYTDLAGTIGLRYPLLGSMETKENAVLIAKSAIDIEGYNALQIKDNDRRSIIASYINYWAAYLKESITNTFLLDEKEIILKLKQRNTKGLLYKSDYYEFKSAFSLAKRNLIRHVEDKNNALADLVLFTSLEHKHFTPRNPVIKRTCITEEDVTNITQESYELKKIKAEIDTIRNILENSSWNGVKSDFSIKQAIGYETNPNGDNSSIDSNELCGE